MKKSILLLVVASATLVSSAPVFAQAQAPSSTGSKMKNAGKKIGNGVMWAPRKVGSGMKKVGESAKNKFHKKSTP